jgi:hypothetical protein
VRILRKGDDADLVDRAHPLRGIRDILLDRVALVFPHALRSIDHEDDRERLSAFDDLRSRQHQHQQRHQNAAQGQRQSLAPQAHIGHRMAVQPPAEKQQRRQQQERNGIGKLNRQGAASFEPKTGKLGTLSHTETATRQVAVSLQGWT